MLALERVRGRASSRRGCARSRPRGSRQAPRSRSSIDGAAASSIVRPVRGSRGEARCSRRTTAREGSPRVERRRDLLRDRARHPADLLAAGVDGDRVRVVRVAGVAAQLERAARLGRVGGERLAVVAARRRRRPRSAARPRPAPAPRGRGSGRRARRAGSPRARRSRRRPGTSSAPRARPRRSSPPAYARPVGRAPRRARRHVGAERAAGRGARRGGPAFSRPARLVLGAAILAGFAGEQLAYAERGLWSARVNLPFQLSDAVTLVSVPRCGGRGRCSSSSSTTGRSPPRCRRCSRPTCARRIRTSCTSRTSRPTAARWRRRACWCSASGACRARAPRCERSR